MAVVDNFYEDIFESVCVNVSTLSKLELWQCGPRLRLSRSRALALSLKLKLNWQFSGLDSRARTALNVFRHALGRRLLTEQETEETGLRRVHVCVSFTWHYQTKS